MTDAITTMSMLEEHELFTIEKMLDEYVDADNTIPAIAWRRLLSDYRTLSARLAERDAEVERLRTERGYNVLDLMIQYRQNLERIAYIDIDVFTPSQGFFEARKIARAALGEKVE